MSADAFTTSIVSATVKIDGVELGPEFLHALEELVVDTAIGVPDRARIVFQDPELKLVDDTKLQAGRKIEVFTAGDRPQSMASIFEGIVSAVEAEIDLRGARLELTAVHAASALQRSSSVRTFRSSTAKDAITKVIAANKTAFGTITCGTTVHEVLHQAGETDWQFVTRMAAQHGSELVTKDGRVVIQPIDTPPKEGPTVELGKNLISYRPRLSGLRQVEEVRVVAWDPSRKEAIVGTAATKPPLDEQDARVEQFTSAAKGGSLLVLDRPPKSSGEATERAKALAKRIGVLAIEGELVCLGNPELKPGVRVKLAGVGKRFGGWHRVVGATHLVGGEIGYTVRLQLGTPPTRIAGSEPRGRRATDSLMIGVVSNVTDPQKLNRVKVKIPVLQDFESDWARVAVGAAGKARGIQMPLHVNDEVLVGFQHGDPEHPIVLGALWNGKDTPGTELTNTKDSVAARFPKEIDVKTEQKLTTLADAGVTVKAQKGPMALEAKDAVTFKSTTGAMTIEAQGKVSMKGTGGVEITGVSQVKLSTSGQMAVEAQGPLQIKGAMVQLQGTSMVKISAPSVMLG